MSLVITNLPLRKNCPSGVVNLLSVLVIGSSVCRGLLLVIHLVKGHSIGVGFTGTSQGRDVIILSEYGLCCTHCLINFASQLWVSWWNVVCMKPCLFANSWKKSALYWDPLTDIIRSGMLWIAKISLNTWITAMDLWFQNYLTSNLNVTDKKVDSLF